MKEKSEVAQAIHKKKNETHLDNEQQNTGKC